MALAFQVATTRDAAALARLHTMVADHLTGLHGPGPWSSKTSENGMLFAMRNSKVYVARDEKEIVATFRLSFKKPWAIQTNFFSPCREPLYLLGLAVAPTRQRQGIGRHCFREAVRVAQRHPADFIRLDAYDTPAGAGIFYKQCGCTERGRVTYRTAPLVYYEFELNKQTPPIDRVI